MCISLGKEARAQAIASIERYFREQMDGEPVGNIAAGALLGFFLDEIAPRSTTRPCPTCRSVCSYASPSWTWKCTKTSSATGASKTSCRGSAVKVYLHRPMPSRLIAASSVAPRGHTQSSVLWTDESA